MPAKSNLLRRAQIEAAAFELLRERGYHSTSMLQIAKRARASNQTLYEWYENKQALLQSILEAEGASTRATLRHALDQHSDPQQALKALGPCLLRAWLGEKAVVLHRAAIVESVDTGKLAWLVERTLRDVIVPAVRSVMERLEQAGVFELDLDVDEAVENYLALLFGDTPMRQALATVSVISEEAIAPRAARAFELCHRLYGRPQDLL